MKKTHLIAFAGLLTALFWPARPMFPDEASNAVSDIPKCSGPVVMDGRLDETDWKNAASFPVWYIHGRKGEHASEPPMVVRYLWDDLYLYIGYEVFDTNLVAVGNGAVQGPAGNRRQGCSIWENPPGPKVDVVEFFITFNDENFFWELHHNASNQFNDVLIITGLPRWKQEKPAMVPYGIYFGNEEYLQDEGEARFASAVSMTEKPAGGPSTVNDPRDADAGYSAEIRLPWYGIGAPATARKRVADESSGNSAGAGRVVWAMGGREIRILAVCQNGDAENRYHHSSPELAGGWFHTQAPAFPLYRLKGP